MSFLCKQIAGDMLCADQNFDIAQVTSFFRSKVGFATIENEHTPLSNLRSLKLCDQGWQVKSAQCFVSVLQPGELIIYYELEESEKSSSRGIVEVCPDTYRSDKMSLMHNSSAKKYFFVSLT